MLKIVKCYHFLITFLTMSTDLQTINSYNSGAEKYNSVQPSSFYHKYVEKPAMFSLLPDLKDRKVLCIGVGTGHEANDLASKGAEVTGIDISEGMIAQAKNNFPEINFMVKDMNNLDFADGSFNIVYSSLAFHYANDLKNLFGSIKRVLKKEGLLIFSTTHPVFDSVDFFEESGKKYTVVGHKKDLATNKVEAIGNYFKEEKRTQDWGDNFIVNFYHKTLTTWINSLIESGFKIKKVLEPMPIPEAKELFPDKYEIYTNRPGYILFLAEKE